MYYNEDFIEFLEDIEYEDFVDELLEYYGDDYKLDALIEDIILETSVNRQLKKAAKEKKKETKRYNKYVKGGGSLSINDWKDPSKQEYEIHQKTGGKLSYEQFMNKKKSDQIKAEAQRKKRLEEREKMARIHRIEANAARNAAEARQRRYSQNMRVAGDIANITRAFIK